MTWNETHHHREGPALPHMGGGSCWDTPAPKTLCPSGESASGAGFHTVGLAGRGDFNYTSKYQLIMKQLLRFQGFNWIYL